MGDIQAVQTINLGQFITDLFAILFALYAAITIVEKIGLKFGIKFKSQLVKEAQTATMLKASKDIDALFRLVRDNESSQEARMELLDDKIDSVEEKVNQTIISFMRWEIINFASNLAHGMNYTEEQFNHVRKVYDEYEQILDETGKKNGYVTDSMNFIKTEYNKKFRIIGGDLIE